MFQLSVELYDTKEKKVVWSDRWQEKWDNLPTIKGSLSDGLLNKAIEVDGNLISAKTLLGTTYTDMGDYDEAMEIFIPTLKQAEELGDKAGMGQSLNSIGIVHYNKGEYNKVVEYLEKSLAIQKEIGFKGLELETTAYLCLTYKHLGKDYNEKHIHSLIKDAEDIEYEINFRLYQLLDDTSYLDTAYKQVQEKASAMEEETGKTFLGYPLPKAIVEDYKKLNKDNN